MTFLNVISCNLQADLPYWQRSK